MRLRAREIVLREIRMPLVEQFEISSGATRDRRICLLELLGSDGCSSWAECVASENANYSSETVDTAWYAITRWLAPRVVGRDFGHPRELYPVLDRGIRGHRMAKAAVEMAFWGLAAERRGQPLAELLGGTRERVGTGISLGIQASPDTLVQRSRRELDRGYRKIKLKIRPGADVEFVGAVREALGPDAPLAVDANGAYELSEATALSALDEAGLMMIEQPLAADDLYRHSKLQATLATPLCLDESIRGPRHVEDMIEMDAARIVNLKPGRVGGLARSLEIHRICHRRELPLWCGGMLETGIGRAYNVALASLPGFTLPGDLSPSRRYWERDIVHPEWTMDEEGSVAVPRSEAGLGVSVDGDRVDELTVRRESLAG